MKRTISLEQAKALFPHRYTMEHVPAWAKLPHEGKFYAPQFRTDKEWYDNTKFRGESEFADNISCHTSNQTWPLGQWLDKPFKKA